MRKKVSILLLLIIVSMGLNGCNIMEENSCSFIDFLRAYYEEWINGFDENIDPLEHDNMVNSNSPMQVEDSFEVTIEDGKSGSF